jgi:hypothetical protein
MLLIHPQFSPITAINLCNCFKITIGLMVKSLEWFPSSPATELGRMLVSLVLSNLDYCPVMWSSEARKYLVKLQLAQNKAV